ncbi:MAG: sulfotransferase family protein [Desulfurivibrionaceae bacterium]
MSKDIIFMLGCPRSGTTFLNSLIRDEMDVGFGPELQMIPKYYKKKRHYGDLSDRNNFSRLIQDMLKERYFYILENNYSEKLGVKIKITKEHIISQAPELSLSGAIYGILKSTADVLGKKHVGNKHLAMLLHPDWMEELFPNCRVINVIRDGRDCALSLTKTRWGHTNTYAAATFWAKNIDNGRMLAKKYQNGRYMELRYEDFLQKPEEEAYRLWRFINNQNKTENGHKSFSHISSQVRAGNSNKWKDKMSVRDIAIFQNIAGEQLRVNGYEIAPCTQKLYFFQKWYYALENEIHREYKVRFKNKLRK